MPEPMPVLVPAVIALEGREMKAASEIPPPELEQKLLALARTNAAKVYSDLVNFICRERMERFRAPKGESIGKQIDVLTSHVALENGRERYTEVFQNQKSKKSIASVGGAWSEGEYATFLLETTKVLDSGLLRLRSMTSVNGVPAALYSFQFDEANTPWDIEMESRSYPVGFLCEVWISPATGEVLRISRSSTSISPKTNLAEVDWMVDFSHFDLDGKTFLLPKEGVYSVTYLNTRKHEWNVITFSDYHHYGSDVAVHFE